MSLIKSCIFLILLISGSIFYAQDLSRAELDKLEMTLDETQKQAELYFERGDYHSAKDEFYNVIKIATDLENSKTIGTTYTKIAKLQYFLNEPEKAMSSLTKAVSLQREIDDKVNLGLTYNIRGVIHSNLEEYDEALRFYNSALDNFIAADVEKYQAEVNLNQARVFLKINQIENAQKKLERDIVIAKKYELYRVLSSSHIFNAKAFF